MLYPTWRGVVLVTILVMSSTGCPPPENIKPCICTTRADEVQIWCSHSELSSVLMGLQAVGSQLKKPIDELILENNAMTALPGRAFASLRVIRIMLRDNKLERVATNWLAGLEETLLEVFIVEPELKSLPEDSFETLTKLEAVTLKAGFMPRFPNFSNLARLKYIHTELPSLSELTPGRINNLESLEILQMIGSPGLKTLESSALQDLPRLINLNFTGCGITWIHPRAMSRLPSLKELTFSYNNIVDAGEVGRSIRELPHLSVLRIDWNKLSDLRETSFVDIPPLKEIYMDHNNIIEIQRGAFHRLPSLKKLDLSHNRIRKIFPEFFLQSYESQIEELNLMNNEIDHIMALTIVMETLPRLRFLDVSNNHLMDIMFGAMRGHPTLERLHLNNNHLKRVVREAFSGFPALRELRLRNNSLSNYLEMPLWNLPSLKGLDLANNEFRRLDRRVLANLPSLRRLDASRNNLIVVDPASFLATPALEHVNLSHNAIDMITPHTFPHLMNLFELDVGSNRLRGIIPGLPRGVEYLYMPRNQLTVFPRAPSPDLLLPALRLLDLNGNDLKSLPPEAMISMPLLQKLYLGDNELQRIEYRTFDGLGRLERLDLHDNKITDIDENAFRDMRRLQELNLKNNRLDTIQTELLKENSALKNLDLSHNLIANLSSTTFENNRLLRDLSLAYNTISEFPDALMNLPQLTNLDMSNNRILQLFKPLNSLKSLNSLKLSQNKIQTLVDGTFSQMDNLTTLDLENNEIQYLSPHVIKAMPSLVNLKLSKNKLSTIPSAAFSDLPQLMEVELQENQLTHLASDSFSGVPNLLMLNLSHNQLSSLDRAGLHGIKSMEILDISHNKVSRLNTPGLPNLDSLIQLRMDHNKLCNIQGTPFTRMSHLRMLSLRNNKLISLSENSFQPLRSTIYQLDIEGNPLKCSCGLLWLQNWVKEGPYVGPRCSDGSLLKDYRLSRQDCLEPKNDDFLQNCEEGATAIGNTQQLLTSSWKDPSLKPLPEETDYFYEDYVEYEDNSTVPLANQNTKIVNISSINNNNIVQQYAVSSTAAPIVLQKNAITPSSMSHFVSGDTPTIYAKPGSSLGPNLKPTKSPGSTQFTFFGMPLPTLNIGSFWGSGRNNDGKSRFPGAKGRVQQVTLPPVMEEGFKPMYPERGGFKPIFNPYNRTEEPVRTMEPIKAITVRPGQFNGSMRDHKSNNIPKEIVVPKKDLKPQDQLAQLTGIVYEKSTTKPPQTVVTQTTTPSIFHLNRLEPEELTTSLLETGSGEVTDIPFPGVQSSTTAYTAPPVATSTKTTYHSIEQMSSLAFDEISVEESDDVKQTPLPTIPPKVTNLSVGGSGPSPLSGFLAPGGQLPPRTHGRPTITKVTMSPSVSSTSSAVMPPVAEEIQGPIPSFKNAPDQSEKPRQNHSIAWYYKNYNKTNLKPYVGPGFVSATRSSANVFGFYLPYFTLSFLVTTQLLF